MRGWLRAASPRGQSSPVGLPAGRMNGFRRAARMQEESPSRTALATAFTRALHLCIDDPPPILEDAVALRLLPSYQRRYLRRLGALSAFWRGRYRRRIDALAAMRTQIVLRARYAEDMLVSAREAGAGRYVVLAAGLDTFAFRQAPPAIDVLEIDHPATQEWKRGLLSARGLAIPPGLEFLPVDFERSTLGENWPDGDTPDFISWLGATYYLSRNAVAATLKTLAARTRPGSRLVLDYWREDPPTVAGNLLLLGARFAVAMQREPIESLFDPAEIADLAASNGWRVLENLSPEEQNRRYLSGRRDALAVPSFAWLLHIEVPEAQSAR